MLYKAKTSASLADKFCWVVMPYAGPMVWWVGVLGLPILLAVHAPIEPAIHLF